MKDEKQFVICWKVLKILFDFFFFSEGSFTNPFFIEKIQFIWKCEDLGSISSQFLCVPNFSLIKANFLSITCQVTTTACPVKKFDMAFEPFHTSDNFVVSL